MKPPSPRINALIAGTAYLVMAIIAVACLFDPKTVPIVAAADAPWPDAVPAGLLKLVVGMGTIAGLDVVVALALYGLFRREAPKVSAWMAGTRIVYALLFALAISHAAAAYGVTRAGPADAAGVAAMLDAYGRFKGGWDFSFFVFAPHLALLGWLVWDRSALRKGLAILLGIAALGYFIDSVIAFAAPAITFRLGIYTFVGELTLIAWLFLQAGRRQTGSA